jgi:beta-arabinofuranosyltransferase
MPHFIFGRGKYDNWITHEAITAGYRQVIDASETCLLVHIRHDYHLVAGTENQTLSTRNQHGKFDIARVSRTQFWSEGKRSKYELFVNIYLSLHTGSYTNQMGSVLFAPWKLARCAEPSGMCLINRKRPGKCPCEYSSYSSLTQTDPTVKEGSRVLRCGLLSQEKKDTFSIPVSALDVEQEPSSFGMPLTMRSVAEKVVRNNTIIISAVTFAYRIFLMNWVCNLRELGITNFVVAALDVDMYKYGYVRGIPTYHESSVFDNDASLTDAAYGTDSFKKITKAKSKVVLRFLKEGYNVLWSDCDVIFFKNPLAYLWSVKGDLVIQSNAPDGESSNARRRLNSGFYLAFATPHMVTAFERILLYALKSSMSEQPCFYDILCGKLGEHAVGHEACNGQGVDVKVLDRALFPHGLTRNMWESEGNSIKEKVTFQSTLPRVLFR